jgi:hypothetical protein
MGTRPTFWSNETYNERETAWTRNFLNAGNREWGGTMLGDLIDGADWIVTQGVADKKRLGISGASYRR